MRLIIGAGGGIGRALVEYHLKSCDETIVAIGRREETGGSHPRLRQWPSDYSEESLQCLAGELREFRGRVSLAFICNGILHDEGLLPEKRLEDFRPSSFERVLRANAMLPLLWLKHLRPVLAGDHDCRVGVLSARVGSIRDNRLGGWYSYRASKAALNMLLKSAAVEYARRAKNVKLLALHPGTTDTSLSRPFQKNVPAEKLFPPSFVAERLSRVVASAPVDGELSFLDWRGATVEW